MNFFHKVLWFIQTWQSVMKIFHKVLWFIQNWNWCFMEYAESKSQVVEIVMKQKKISKNAQDREKIIF